MAKVNMKQLRRLLKARERAMKNLASKKSIIDSRLDIYGPHTDKMYSNLISDELPIPNRMMSGIRLLINKPSQMFYNKRSNELKQAIDYMQKGTDDLLSRSLGREALALQ